MSDIYVSAKTTMDIGDKDNTHISTSKHMNGYIEDYIENLSTNEVLDFVIDSEQAKADTSFVPVPLWNYKIACWDFFMKFSVGKLEWNRD